MTATSKDGQTGTATISYAVLPPEPGTNFLDGIVTELLPHGASVSPRTVVEAHKPVAFQEIDAAGKVTTASATTDAAGTYSFSQLPTCGSRHDACTVRVSQPGPATLEDQRSVSFRGRLRAIQDLLFGRVPDRYLLSGTVRTAVWVGSLPRGAATPPPPETDLQITIAGQRTPVYDAANAKCPSPFQPGVGVGRPNTQIPCTGTSGDYLLDQIPIVSHSLQPTSATLTLLERSRAGSPWVAVDSAPITLPADIPSNQTDPPTITAPDLQPVIPIP